MKCPCDDCIVTVPCREMCEKSKPYFESLVIEDKNFDWSAYEEHRQQIHQRLVNELVKEGNIEKARQLASLNYLDMPQSTLKELKEIEDAAKTRGRSTGTKIFRKIKHFCTKYFENQKSDQG